MVEGNNPRTVYEREASQYKFDFCKDCSFYECELVEEYIQFRKNHTHAQGQQLKTLVNVVDADSFDFTKNGGRIIQAKAVIPMSDVQDDENVINLTYSYSGDVDSDISDTDMLSYDQSNLQDGCFMDYRHVNQIECGRKKVVEGIGEHYKVEIDDDGNIKENIEDRWEPVQPVFISAQTGQGKNYFVENTLISYVKELNYQNKTDYRVLIIGNRRSLKKQIENRLKQKKKLGDRLNDEDEIIYDEDEIVRDYLNNTDVITYQGLLKRKGYFCNEQRYTKSKYLFVICDEAHFFTSDAMFNPYTKEILCAIIKTFYNAVRVYMSATPYECLPYIIKYEEEYLDKKNYRKYLYDQSKWKYGQMVFYHFQRDYSYLEVNSYTDIRELYNEIIRSFSKKEKWFIFIDNKEKCNQVEEELKKYMDKSNIPANAKKETSTDKDSKKSWIAVMNADGKNDETYQSIVLKEKLNENIRVLISTSVLDNGINLTNVDNIVVSDMSKVKCLQMAGRARVSDKNSHKRLYIRRFDKGYVKRRKDDLNNLKDIYHEYDMAYEGSNTKKNKKDKYDFLEKYYDGNNENRKKAKHLFWRKGYEPETLGLNEIARSLVEKNISIYEKIFKEMETEEKQQEDDAQGKKEVVGKKYLEYQLSWFGKEYCEDDDITFADTEKAKKEFMAFLEPYAESGKHIEDTGKGSPFRKKFTDLSKIAFGSWNHNTERCHSITVMNKILKKENINYKIVSHLKYWVVERYNWEMEDSE